MVGDRPPSAIRSVGPGGGAIPERGIVGDAHAAGKTDARGSAGRRVPAGSVPFTDIFMQTWTSLVRAICRHSPWRGLRVGCARGACRIVKPPQAAGLETWILFEILRMEHVDVVDRAVEAAEMASSRF